MKIRIQLKDPDGVGNALHESAADLAAEIQQAAGNVDLGEGPYDAVYHEMSQKIKTWVECQEYITIEIDTEAGTAVVVPVRQP